MFSFSCPPARAALFVIVGRWITQARRRVSSLLLPTLLAGTALAPVSVQAYSLIGPSWASGDITMHLQLGAPSAPLSDGSTNWNLLAETAFQEWNQHLTRSRFTFVRESTAARTSGNRLNNIFFSSSVYGESWGNGVLAVTLSSRNSRNTNESDVLFNSRLQWDSYRGPLRRNVMDFYRVALHEFGHVLGLDHPDEARQSVTALMNSTVSNLDSIQADDIAGVRALYQGTAAAGIAPSILAQPSSTTVQVTGSYTMNVAAAGTGPLSYEWSFRPAGTNTEEPLLLADGPSYTIGSVQSADAGTYSVLVSNAMGSVESSSASLQVTPITTNPDTTLVNISTRGVAGSGGAVLIAGLIIGGNTPKQVLVRAAGPALGDFNVPGVLSDPELTLYDSGGKVVARNDNWGSDGNSSTLAATFSRLGAFQFKANSRDAALLVSLPPGNYTAHVSGVSGTTGVALVEAYDADPDAATARTRRLLNIATRGQVGTGDNVLIAGLIVTGPGPRTFLIRGVGPTLGRAPYNVSGALSDPLLQLYQGETLLRENDDWDSPSNAQAALRAAATKVGAFSLLEERPANSGLDAAMLVTLQPGTYTAKLSGFENVTGIGLIEVYEVN
jgi:predicted Zn-dependent protease